jgi:glycosyltransferase involved in cell wall biosynthesis
MLFSILVANYNNGHFFKECHKSIIAQTYNTWEVIIVDDCSTDDSIDIINNLIKTDNRFKLFINDKNEGCGYTKKRCIDNASGDWCGFVDPDDLIFPNALDAMINGIMKDNNSVAFFSDNIHTDERLKGKFITKYSHNKVIDYLYDPYSCNHFFVFNRSAYLNTDGIDPSIKRAVDQDLYLNLAMQGYFTYIQKVLYVYRKNSGSISLNNNELKAKAWSIKVAINHCERREINFEDIIPLHLVSCQLKSNIIVRILKRMVNMVEYMINKITAIKKMQKFRNWFNSI